jgi:hypothetical protein
VLQHDQSPVKNQASVALVAYTHEYYQLAKLLINAGSPVDVVDQVRSCYCISMLHAAYYMLLA